MGEETRSETGSDGSDTGATREPRQYRRGRWFWVENELMGAMTRLGVIPRTYLLTTVGRKTGKERSNPVTIVQVSNKRWLVAPYGVVPWVLNARAAGEVRITRRGSTHRFRVREVPADEAAPVLKRYVTVATVARPYFRVDRSAPVDAFAAEAASHPVFELMPLDASDRT